MIVEIGSIDIKIKDVLSLRTGDCLKLTNIKTTGNFFIKIGNKNKFECRPGRIGSKIAVQIMKVLADKVQKEFEDLETGGEE
jgi:flagellar motor switch protein FliM